MGSEDGKEVVLVIGEGLRGESLPAGSGVGVRGE